MQDHLAPGRTPTTDAEHRIRLDDLEMRPLIQEEVAHRFAAITQENFNTLADYPRYKAEFLRLFGFGVPGIDYSVPVETQVGW
jgi:enoyl-[acyl-carrier protein] reductase/trans-2-enoyl-CoA reductase (NAD+)